MVAGSTAARASPRPVVAGSTAACAGPMPMLEIHTPKFKKHAFYKLFGFPNVGFAHAGVRKPDVRVGFAHAGVRKPDVRGGGEFAHMREDVGTAHSRSRCVIPGRPKAKRKSAAPLQTRLARTSRI